MKDGRKAGASCETPRVRDQVLGAEAAKCLRRVASSNSPDTAQGIEKLKTVQSFWLLLGPQGNDGGRYWIRTSDPSDVNTVLYQLS